MLAAAAHARYEALGRCVGWPAGPLIIAPGTSPAGPPFAANLRSVVRRPGPYARPQKKAAWDAFFGVGLRLRG